MSWIKKEWVAGLLVSFLAWSAITIITNKEAIAKIESRQSRIDKIEEHVYKLNATTARIETKLELLLETKGD